MKPVSASMALTIALALTGAAQAQPAQPPGSNPDLAQPATGPASPLKNMGPYAGTSREGFYDPEQRITQLRATLKLERLDPRTMKKVAARLSAISAELKYRSARHSDGLRDWDRELINEKLDALVKQYPALAT